MKKILFLLISLLPIQNLFATSIPEFPMTIYGTLKAGTSDMSIGTILTFSDGNNTTIGTYTTTLAGWYGFDSTIAGTSPTFSDFTGSLKITVQFGGKSYNINSISTSSSGCTTGSNITFVSNVCRYDISLNTTTTPSGGGGGGGGGGGSSSTSLATTNTTPTTQTGTTTATGNAQTGSQNTTGNNANSPSSVKTQISNPVFSIKPSEAKKGKTIITQTELKRGTQIIIYRVLPNGKEVRTGTTRVLPNGKIRFTTRLAGKYKMKVK